MMSNHALHEADVGGGWTKCRQVDGLFRRNGPTGFAGGARLNQGRRLPTGADGPAPDARKKESDRDGRAMNHWKADDTPAES